MSCEERRKKKRETTPRLCWRRVSPFVCAADARRRGKGERVAGCIDLSSPLPDSKMGQEGENHSVTPTASTLSFFVGMMTSAKKKGEGKKKERLA